MMDSFKFIKWSICLITLLASIVIAQKPAEQELLKKILNDYDKRIRPINRYNASDPVKVSVNLYVRSIDILDESKMECSVQLTFRQEWNDGRLRFNPSSHVDYITLTEVHQVWRPDIFFSNEKRAHIHDLMVPNHYMRIYPDGNVLYSSRISLTLTSPMNLRRFPFDNQECSIRMASYGYTNADVHFIWKTEDPVQVPDNLQLGLFRYDGSETSTCDSTTNTGTYSCLRVNLDLLRQFKYYLVQMYIPCCMLTICSWLPFWLDRLDGITARTLVGISSLLVMATQVSSYNRLLPPVSYTKAMDVWTGICLTFIFAAVIESIVVNHLARKEQKSSDGSSNEHKCSDVEIPLNEIHSEDVNESAPVPGGEGGDGNAVAKQGTLKKMTKNYMAQFTARSERIDGVSRVAFPVAFLLFIIIYFIGYCS